MFSVFGIRLIDETFRKIPWFGINDPDLIDNSELKAIKTFFGKKSLS